MRFSIRREDRRNLVVGFVGLLAIMTAHSVMETARDTLFLTSLPATHLPRAYLAIALLAILELRIHERVLRHVRDRRKLLSASLVFGSFITLSFWAFLEEMGAWAPFGFYVWTGLLITVVLIEFWLLLDDAVTVTQAKRIFPAIAAGGVTGAMLGSLLAEGSTASRFAGRARARRHGDPRPRVGDAVSLEDPGRSSGGPGCRRTGTSARLAASR